MTDTDPLWGGTLTDLRTDLNNRTVAMEVTAGTTVHEILMTGVSALRVERPDANPWDYTEVTEIHVSANGPKTHIEIVLWTEPNGLWADCEQVTVTSLR
jgi:hypothetical protein